MSKQVTLENTGLGGFGLPTGQVIAAGGQIVVEPEVWAASKDHPVVAALVNDGTLIVDGRGKKKPASDAERDENGDTAEMAEMRKRFDASLAAVTAKLQAEMGKVADLEKAIAERDARVADLGGSSGSLKAEHRGGGKFTVTEGDVVHLSGLSKADAGAFNAMSAADQKTYIETERAKAGA